MLVNPAAIAARQAIVVAIVCQLPVWLANAPSSVWAAGPRAAQTVPAATNAFDELLLQLVRDAVPQQYENHKHWGKTKEVFAGLHIRREGLEIRTKRRRKEVNHGDWRMYRIILPDPQRDLHIELLNARESAEGNLRFDLRAVASLETFGRYSAWRYDVQLFSLSALAHTRVQLTADCEVALRFDPVHLPPDIVLVPRVHDAKLELLEFELERLSQIHGDVAEELGNGLRLILDEVLEEKRDKLTERMNRQIAKHQDEFRLSLHDLATSRWKQGLPLLPHTPNPAGAAIDTVP